MNRPPENQRPEDMGAYIVRPPKNEVMETRREMLLREARARQAAKIRKAIRSDIRG